MGRRFYVQDPDEIVFLADGDVPDAQRGLTEDRAKAMVFAHRAEAEAWRDRLDPHLGPLCVVELASGRR